MMKHPIRTVGVAAACAGLALAGAQTAAAEHETAAASLAFDQHFVVEAGQGNWFEVGAGKLAVQYGSSGVCQAGQKLAADHQKAQAALRAVHRQVRGAFPDAPSPVQSWLITQLSATAGTGGGRSGSSSCSDAGDTGGSGGSSNGFDGQWLTLEIANHVQDLTMYAGAAGATRSAVVRRYACKQLPVLRSHLAMLKKAIRQTGQSVSSSAAPPPTPSACR
jgi:predicted outer membrane protein